MTVINIGAAKLPKETTIRDLTSTPPAAPTFTENQKSVSTIAYRVNVVFGENRK